MTRMYWIRRRWRGLGAIGAALLAALLIYRLLAAAPAPGVTALGDAAAPRAARGPAVGRALPRSGDGAAPLGPDANSSLLDRAAARGPQTVAAAQAAWSPAETRERQHLVLAAINCARQAQHQGALALDPALSATAAEAWLRLVDDRSFSLRDLPGAYALRGVLALDSATAEDAPARCGAGGFDAAALPPAPAGTTIGIAVFPPQAPWDSPSAVVLVK